jgi:hypothetical protein
MFVIGLAPGQGKRNPHACFNMKWGQVLCRANAIYESLPDELDPILKWQLVSKPHCVLVEGPGKEGAPGWTGRTE